MTRHTNISYPHPTIKVALGGGLPSWRHSVSLSPDARARLAAVLEKKIRPPRQKRLPVVLSDAQIRALLDRVKNPIHKTCLTVMYACGLRIGEATTLEVTAVDGANRVLRIIGKGDKERRVPLPQPVLDDLRGLWRTHRNPRWLFPNHSGTKPINQQVLCHRLVTSRFRS